ncbi:MAG: hypothetical protein ACI92G_003097 [Candidatus Pelagisphaera sp.]|jgi:hypothetical protein
MPLKSEYIGGELLRVSFGDVVLFDYTYKADTNRSYCPRPFMHPIRTLAGDVLTNSRPSDHPWHNGLSMTLNNVNGMNFWGGPTYTRETGQYADYPNVGKQIHRDWKTGCHSEKSHSWIETLDWTGPNDEHVFTETRTLTVTDIDTEIGLWRLIWKSSLVNVLGEKLSINSYCSGEGLEGSGYTGLFLRMSRGYNKIPEQTFHDGKTVWDDYHDDDSIIESAEAINGWKKRRLAYQGAFDTSLNGALLLCEDITENPPYELHWFHRPSMPCLAWSTAFHKSLVVEADASITFAHSLGIVNGFWTKDGAKELWMKR